jgi:hypothetical protein
MRITISAGVPVFVAALLACGETVQPRPGCPDPLAGTVPADTGWRSAIVAGALRLPPDTSIGVLASYRDSITETDRERLRAAGATITVEWSVITGLAFHLRAADLPSFVAPDGPLPDSRVRSAELDRRVCVASETAGT